MQVTKTFLKDCIFITVGALILAVGINIFLVPMKLSTGGVSGIGTVLYHLFSVPMSVTTLVLNAVMFLFGIRTLEKGSLIKTVAGILLLSLFLELTQGFGTYIGDIFIASVFGGVLVGLGVGMTVLKGASTGGSDFAAIMLNRIFPHISVSAFILMTDATIILVSGVIFGNYSSMLYSTLSLYIGIKVADAVLVSGDHAKSVLIISKNSNDIAQNIISAMQRGVTGIYSKGLYNQKDALMLMCIVRSKEIPKLLSIVRFSDNDAFTVISDVRKVCGEGFRKINDFDDKDKKISS